MRRPTDIANEAKLVGIWIRVSTEDQAKGESPEHHERRARYYAESKGWKVVEVYDLAGVSGKSVMEHPECKRMLGDLKRGHITGLIFSKLARLARNTRELLDFSDIFREAGADLVSLQESIDTSTPAGRLFYTMIAAMAQWEREEIASRVAASVAVRAKMGKSLGGQAPFGYQWKDRQLVPHPDEAPVCKLLYDLFLETKRKKAVARELNDRGYRTRNGSKFSDSTVSRLIEDPTNKGFHRLNHTKSQGTGKSWERKPESEWEYVKVEPIVPADLWDRCNAILTGMRASMKRPAKRAVHLFAGLTFCGCGAKMYLPSAAKKYTCVTCKNKIPAEDLEAVYLAQLQGFFLSPEEVSAQIQASEATYAEREQLLELKRRELAKTQSEIDRNHRLYLDEKLDGDAFVAIYKPLFSRKKEIEEELPKAEAELDSMRVNRLSTEEIVSEAGTLHARWPNLTPDERRAVVESITERIVVGRGSDAEIEIELAALPFADGGKNEALPSPIQNLTERQRGLRGSWLPPA